MLCGRFAAVLLVCVALCTICTATSVPEDSVVPEAEFMENYNLGGALKSSDAQKQDKIMKHMTKILKTKITVPEVPKGETDYEKQVTDVQKAGITKGAKALDKASKDRDWHAEALRLRKDHEGSLDKNSPWNKAEAQTKGAGKSAVQAYKEKWSAEEEEADAAKAHKHRKAFLSKQDKKRKTAIARQDAWDRDEAAKDRAAAAKAHTEAEDAQYDKIVNKKWINRLKKSKNPVLRARGHNVEDALHKKEEADKHMKKPVVDPKKPHTDKPPPAKVVVPGLKKLTKA